MTNDKQRLVELLNKKYDHFCDQCGVNKDSHYTDNLADYLLANGVILPPCKVGDVVYALYNKEIYKTKVFSMVAETEDNKWVYILKCKIFNGISMFKKFLFGKTVFLTKEEAEQALVNYESVKMRLRERKMRGNESISSV